MQQLLSQNKETNLPGNWIQVTQINPNMQIHLHSLSGVSCNAPASTKKKNNNQIMVSRDNTYQTTNMTRSLTDDHIMNINSLSLGFTFIKR